MNCLFEGRPETKSEKSLVGRNDLFGDFFRILFGDLLGRLSDNPCGNLCGNLAGYTYLDKGLERRTG